VGASPSFLSYPIAAYSLGALISSPLWGVLFDRALPRFPVRVFIICAISLCFVGNLLYAIPSQWTILFGRFVSGLGIGLEGAVLGLVSKSTANTDNKPKVIAGLLLMKQMGIIIGPILILAFLGDVPTRCITSADEQGVCTFGINSYNSVAYFQMGYALGLILITGLFVSAFHPPAHSETKQTQLAEGVTKTWRQEKNHGLLNATAVCCCVCTMALFSFQSTLEVVLTPITERYLGFTPMQNAYVYGITGGVSSLGYISLLVIMRHVQERILLLEGMLVQLTICIGLLILLPTLTFRPDWLIPVGAVGCSIFSWHLSYVMAAATTILSKSHPAKHQSTVQSIRVALEKSIMVLSNLWMGAWLHNMVIGFVFPAINLALATAFIALTWSLLRPEAILYKWSSKNVTGNENKCYIEETDC